MSDLLELSFWLKALPVICIVAIPISLIGGSSLLRSVITSIVLYLMFIFVFHIKFTILL